MSIYCDWRPEVAGIPPHLEGHRLIVCSLHDSESQSLRAETIFTMELAERGETGVVVDWVTQHLLKQCPEAEKRHVNDVVTGAVMSVKREAA